MSEKRERLTKNIKNIEKATIEELFLNSCYYDEMNNNQLTFRHLTQNDNAYQLLYDLFETYKDTSIAFSPNLPEDDNDFMRDIFVENSIKDLSNIDGLLCNFFCLIDTNAKLRERLKEYEDKEFGKE